VPNRGRPLFTVPSRRRIARASVVLSALSLLAAAAGQDAASAASSGSTVTYTNVCPVHPAKGQMTCLSMRRTDIKSKTRAQMAAAATTPSGFAPASLASAYDIPTTLGAGSTVAIVDAYDDPTAESDLATYRAQYGLPACTTANGCFHKVNESGGSTLPAADSGWAGEIALDTDMVSAACPLCHILLVEASSANDPDLGTAVNYAAGVSGVKAISNSYGGGESSTDTSEVTKYYTHPGIAITASAGDDGYGAEFPASSPSVIAVGGTSLSKASNTRGWTESVWDTSNSEGTGSGCSAYEAKPAWQVDTGCSKRSVADVSAVADPATGVAVYDSTGSGGWAVYGGTSVSSPLIASMYAEANNPAPSAAYAYATANLAGLNDVTTGVNKSGCTTYLCKAGVGYDGPTGMGTPNGLLALGGTGAVLGGGGGGGGGGTTNSTFSLSLGNSGASVADGATGGVGVSTALTGGSAQNVNLSVSGAPSGVTASFGTGSVQAGGSTTLNVSVASTVPAGTYPLTVTGTGATSGSASATWNLTVTAVTTGACSSAQLLTNPGFESGSTTWTATPYVIARNSGIGAPHAGSYDAWLDGYGTTHTDSVAQTVKVAAGCTKATVSFWMNINTSERSTTAANDKLTVTLGGTTLATYSNLNHTSGYQAYTLTMAIPAGTTSLPLKFTGSENSSLQTSFVIDDTALTLS
jgi:hypothetical protein